MNACGLSCLYLLLQNLENSENKDKNKILHSLGLLLSSNSKVKDEFHKLGGVPMILKFLNEDDCEIAENAFNILGFSILQNVDYQMQLTTELVFKIILKNLRQGTFNHKRSSMFLITCIVEGNVPGQILVRESGCLHQLIEMFHDIVQQTPSQEEDKLKYWYFLCAGIKMCVHNPQNLQNQHQTGLIIPKALTLLDSWFHQAFNRHFTEWVERLIPMLVNIIMDNPTNQLGFLVYSGIHILVRGLNALESWQEAPLNIETTKEKLVYLLDVAICDNAVNCDQAAMLGVIPLLLRMLMNFKDQQKFSLLVTLTHLVESSTKNKEEFLQENGITIVVLATVNLKACSQVTVAANCLLKFCATNLTESKFNSSEYKPQRNLVCCSGTTEESENRQTPRKLDNIELKAEKKNNTVIHRNGRKYSSFNFNDNLPENMRSEEQTCGPFMCNSDSCNLNSLNEEQSQREKNRNSSPNGCAKYNICYKNSHTHNNIRKEENIIIHDQSAIEKNSKPTDVKYNQHYDSCMPYVFENRRTYENGNYIAHKTNQHCKTVLGENSNFQENTSSQNIQQLNTSKAKEFQHSKINNSIKNYQSLSLCINDTTSTASKPLNSHSKPTDMNYNQHYDGYMPYVSENNHIYENGNYVMRKTNQHCETMLRESSNFQENTPSQNNQQLNTSKVKEFQHSNTNDSIKNYQSSSLCVKATTPTTNEAMNSHLKVPSKKFQKEENQLTDSMMSSSIENTPSIHHSLRSYFSYTIQTPLNMTKRYLMGMFHKKNDTEVHSMDRNYIEQNTKTPVNIAEKETPQTELSLQYPQRLCTDKIICSEKSIDDRILFNKSGIIQETGINVSKTQMNSKVLNVEHESKPIKCESTPLKLAVSPDSPIWSSLKSTHLNVRTQSSRQSRNCYRKSYAKPMLRYSKEELNNLVAGIAKYGLDFKAIRRAYCFHRKRTAKDLYLKWRSSFISSRS